MFLNKTPPLCFIKPGLRLICSNFSDIIFYNTKVKINKIIKIIMKKYITDVCKEALISHLNILTPIYGAPARSRTQNLLVRSQALYPVELQAHF